jgi:4-oxalocrotonate tautomerase
MQAFENPRRENSMPLVRIDVRKGKDAAYRQEIGRVVYEALVGVGVPKDDRFQVISKYDADCLIPISAE